MRPATETFYSRRVIANVTGKSEEQEMNKGLTLKLAGLGLGLILTAGAVLAQDTNSPAAPAAPAPAATQAAPAGHGHFGNQLGLTADQKQKLHDIRTQARDRAAIIRNDATLTPAQKQQQLQALHE